MGNSGEMEIPMRGLPGGAIRIRPIPGGREESRNFDEREGWIAVKGG